MNKNKLYTAIGIIGLLCIVGSVIYIIGSFICFGVKTTYDIVNRPTTYINSCDNADMLEPDNESSRPVKGMKYEDSLDSLHIPHIIFDKELNCYTISLAGNKPEDITNYDKLVEQMNRLEYDRNIYKDCTIEDIKLVGTHCTGNIHQAAESISITIKFLIKYYMRNMK